MKSPLDRTKVVLRHLPPTISLSNLVEHINSRFSGCYCWLSFRPGKSGLKHLTYARAYIDFNKPEDVIEFAEFFKGHIFVNEKGSHFKTLVEYAPLQRVPKQRSKKDSREGTILKDPEYLEFLEFLAKPIENLPSAEIQLERKEAERAGAPKDVTIVTPLMDYVRQKRAAKAGVRRIMLNGKPAKRASGMSSKNSVSGSSRRGSEKRRTNATMYVSRDSSRIVSSKDKSTYILVKKQDGQQLVDKSGNSAVVLGNEALEGENGGSAEIGKKKILLLKEKEKEISDVSGNSVMQQNEAIPSKTSYGSSPLKQNQQREASGRIIRSSLLNRGTQLNQPSLGSQTEQRIQTSNQDRGKKPPRTSSMQSLQKDTIRAPEDKVVGNDLHPLHAEKQERRTRNRDRPDRGVWAPRRSDRSHASDESLSLSASQTSHVVDSAEGTRAEVKHDMLVTRGGERRPIGSGESRTIGNGRGSHYSIDNGSFRHGGRRGSAYNVKDTDGSSILDGKSLKRGPLGYASHEKQVWVQKSSSGT